MESQLSMLVVGAVVVVLIIPRGRIPRVVVARPTPRIGIALIAGVTELVGILNGARLTHLARMALALTLLAVVAVVAAGLSATLSNQIRTAQQLTVNGQGRHA
jgi:hypothetical protein